MIKEQESPDKTGNSTQGSLTNALLKNIATLGFIGYLPFAPGTWGTIAALLFVAFIPLSQTGLLAVILFGIIIGSIAAGTAEKLLDEIDSSHIIIDEFVGFLISIIFLPHAYGYLVSAFLLFRFFDILKPFPIGRLEQMIKGGAGIMADDILAGIFTNAALQIWKANF